eukprot:jgi/Astpho2/7042/Aster-01889
MYVSWDECSQAAKAGDLQFLQSKAPFPTNVYTEHISMCAARRGHLNILQWLRLQGAAQDQRACREAAAGGHLIVLQQWTHGNIEMGAAPRLCLKRKHVRGRSQRGPPGSAGVCPPERLCLEPKHERGCSWRRPPCTGGGHLAVLQYAHQNGCAWSPSTCAAAAGGGHLSTLKWLREQGCQWDCTTNIRATVKDHFEVFRWACQQLPPCPLWPHPWDLWVVLSHFHFQISPRLLVHLAQQQAPLLTKLHAQAHIFATEMAYTFLSLKGTLPDRTPHEVVLGI